MVSFTQDNHNFLKVIRMVMLLTKHFTSQSTLMSHEGLTISPTNPLSFLILAKSYCTFISINGWQRAFNGYVLLHHELFILQIQR